MTQSDNIKEFLKYASPRLDYIEHCMEKRAIQNAVRRFAGKPGKRMFSYKNVAKHAPKGSPGTPGGTVNARYAKQYAEQSAALSKELMGKKEYAAAVDKLVQAGYNPTQAARIVQKKLAKGLKTNKQLGAVPETMEQVRSAAGTIRPVKYKHPVSNNSGKVSDTASNAANSDGSGMLDGVKSWIAAHPYLTAGGATIAAGAGGTGLGYGLGHGTGQQEGAQTAQRYYEMMMALDRARMRNANDSFLTRLANLFGTGELSNMIG
jgi:hypothetical protein